MLEPSCQALALSIWPPVLNSQIVQRRQFLSQTERAEVFLNPRGCETSWEYLRLHMPSNASRHGQGLGSIAWTYQRGNMNGKGMTEWPHGAGIHTYSGMKDRTALAKATTYPINLSEEGSQYRISAASNARRKRTRGILHVLDDHQGNIRAVPPSSFSRVVEVSLRIAGRRRHCWA
jgi:hypothetical protein